MDKLTYPPAWTGKYQTGNISFFDLDNFSSREVVAVGCEAVKRSDSGIVCIDIQDESVSLTNLFPLFKAILSRDMGFHWFIAGRHERIGIFLKKAKACTIVSDYSELEKNIERFFAQNCDSW